MTDWISLRTRVGICWALGKYGFIIYEGLEGLVFFSLKHHFDLVPAPFALVFNIWINVQGFKEVQSSSIKRISTPLPDGGIKRELQGFPAGVVDLEAILCD